MKRLLALASRIEWPNVLFLTLTPAIAFGGTFFLWKNGDIMGPTLILALIMAIFTGLGITAGYHRLFSHRAYDAAPWYKLVMLLFGAAAFENSALRWASDHRTHHKYVDTDKDPYNIKRGFFYAHMGWVMLKYDASHQYDNVVDLEKDALVRFQDRHYVKLGIAVGFLLPTLIASLWGDPLGGFFIAGFLRTVMNHHFTFSINSFAHLIGKRPYSEQNSSRDSWFLALVTYGEGYHNYHHTFPTDYRNGVRAYQWDPTKWLVKALSYVGGSTYNLRQMPTERILAVRLRMDEKRIMRRMERHPERAHSFSHELITTTRARIEEAYAHVRQARLEMQRIKEQKLHAWNEQIAHFNERVEALKTDLANAQTRLRQAKATWANICGALGVRSNGLIYG